MTNIKHVVGHLAPNRVAQISGFGETASKRRNRFLSPDSQRYDLNKYQFGFDFDISSNLSIREEFTKSNNIQSKIFGHSLNDSSMRRLAGSPGSSRIGYATRMYEVSDKLNVPEFNLSIHNSNFDGYLDVQRLPAGRGLRIDNICFFASPDALSAGKASSVDALLSTVSEAKRLGIKSIHTGGQRGWLEDGYSGNAVKANGYNSWHKLGFNAPLRAVENEAGQRNTLFAALDANGLSEYKRKTLRDLTSHPVGKRLWKKYGDYIALSMDLRPHSEDLKVFSRFLAEHGARAAGIRRGAIVAKSAHLAPGRTAEIAGLGEKGLASVMRKAMTAFGSPWQGLGDRALYSENLRSGFDGIIATARTDNNRTPREAVVIESERNWAAIPNRRVRKYLGTKTELPEWGMRARNERLKQFLAKEQIPVKAIMKSGTSHAMATAGTGTVSSIARGARKMFHL